MYSFSKSLCFPLPINFITIIKICRWNWKKRQPNLSTRNENQGIFTKRHRKKKYPTSNWHTKILFRLDLQCWWNKLFTRIPLCKSYRKYVARCFKLRSIFRAGCVPAFGLPNRRFFMFNYNFTYWTCWKIRVSFEKFNLIFYKNSERSVF